MPAEVIRDFALDRDARYLVCSIDRDEYAPGGSKFIVSGFTRDPHICPICEKPVVTEYSEAVRFWKNYNIRYTVDTAPIFSFNMSYLLDEQFWQNIMERHVLIVLDIARIEESLNRYLPQ